MCLSVDARPFQADLEGRHGQTAADLVKRKLKQTKQMEWLKRGGGGTEIFMLLHKERDRATDWCWEIWRELGGELPTTLDVMVPALQMTVRLPMPTGDYLGDTSQFGTMSRQGVIKACEKALGSLPTFQRIKQQRESETGEVVELALAWQTNGRLDWVTQQQDLDVEGRKRYWSVLGGFGTMPVSRTYTAKYSRVTECFICSTLRLARSRNWRSAPSTTYQPACGSPTASRLISLQTWKASCPGSTTRSL